MPHSSPDVKIWHKLEQAGLEAGLKEAGKLEALGASHPGPRPVPPASWRIISWKILNKNLFIFNKIYFNLIISN